MTNDTNSRQVALPKVMLTSSLFLGICSIICLRVLRPETPLFGVSLGLLLVCLLPWLVLLRRKFWSRRFAEGGKWRIAVTVLLWVCVLIGPVVTGSFWLWTRFADAPDNMARLVQFLGIVVYGVMSFSAAYWVGALAFLIQLWRDQWCARLTTVAVGYLFLVFAFFCFTVV